MTALPEVSTRRTQPLAAGSLVTWTPSQREAVPMVKQSMSAVLLALFMVWEPGMPRDAEMNGGRPDNSARAAKHGEPAALLPLNSMSAVLSRDTNVETRAT